MSMAGPKKILEKYGIHPQKSLGQSFLQDANMAAKIVKAARIGPEDTVLEIGAGCGVLTAMIARRAKRVIAIDVDPRMMRILGEELSGMDNVEVVEADILTYDVASALEASDEIRRLKVVGNIPYNISTQILFTLIDARKFITEMVLMFQKEVGERIIAPPGGKDYGILSVVVSMYTVASKLLAVPAQCFYPKPEVESVVLRLVVRDEPAAPVFNHDLFRMVVKTAFAKRRKTILNNLKSLAAETDMRTLLEGCGIDPKRRGETLSVQEFAVVTSVLESTNCLTK